MDKKCKCPINLAYCLDMSMVDDKNAMSKLLQRLPDYFRCSVNNRGYDVYVSHNGNILIINLCGNMDVDFTLVNTSSASYHYEIDGESTFDCMTKEDFDQIIIDAFQKCAKDILEGDILDGDTCKAVYLSESIKYYMEEFEDIGYPCENDIWELLD